MHATLSNAYPAQEKGTQKPKIDILLAVMVTTFELHRDVMS